MIIKLQPQPKQMEALEVLGNKARPKVVGYGGSRGGGKSWLSRAWQLNRRFKYPGTSGVIIRKTYPELLNNHIEMVFKENPFLRDYWRASDKMLKFPNGATLYFRHLQNPDDVYNFHGQEFEDIVLDEAQMHTEDTFQILRSSNRTTNPEITPKMLLTFNPGGVGSGFIKRLFIDRMYNSNEDPDDYAFVQAKVYDNKVLLDNDPGYLKTLEALPENLRKAYLEGDWDVFDGQFFESWNREVHVIEPRYNLKEVPDNFEFRLCWDDGTRAPRGVLVLVQDNDGFVDCVWEYYKAGELATEAARNIKERLREAGLYDILVKKGLFVYDPSMDNRNSQTGIASSVVVANILGVRRQKGNNNRIEGWRRVKEYLQYSQFSSPLLRIWKGCLNLIRTMPQQIYTDNREDLDTTGEDHLEDALRYGLMSFNKLPPRLGGLRPDLKIVTSTYKPLGGYHKLNIKKEKPKWQR